MVKLNKSVCSLLYIKMENKLLLARKKRGFGYGMFNGVGGKMQAGENITQTMLRETMEEIGVVPTGYELVSVLKFDEYVKGVRELVEVDVFLADGYDGTIAESEEMDPQWFELDNLPYDNMFPDSKYFLPDVLEGKKVKGFFKYDEEFNILENRLEVVKKL